MIEAECWAEMLLKTATTSLSHANMRITCHNTNFVLEMFRFHHGPFVRPFIWTKRDQWNFIYGKTVIRKSNYGRNLYTNKHRHTHQLNAEQMFKPFKHVPNKKKNKMLTIECVFVLGMATDRNIQMRILLNQFWCFGRETVYSDKIQTHQQPVSVRTTLHTSNNEFAFKFIRFSFIVVVPLHSMAFFLSSPFN